jgi:hypothetical protein
MSSHSPFDFLSTQFGFLRSASIRSGLVKLTVAEIARAYGHGSRNGSNVVSASNDSDGDEDSHNGSHHHPTATPVTSSPAATNPNSNSTGGSNLHDRHHGHPVPIAGTVPVPSSATPVTAPASPVGTSAVTKVFTPGSGLVINLHWDSSVASASAAFKDAVVAAASYLEKQFSNAVTLNINVGFGEVGGTKLSSGTLGSSQSSYTNVTYSAFLAAYKSLPVDGTKASCLQSLPTGSPVSGSITLTTAQAKALNLSNVTAIDGSIGFDSSVKYSYNPNAVAAGTYDFNAVALHELSEILGRQVSESSNSKPSTTGVLNLFDYTAPNVINITGTGSGYFSIDGGKTTLAAFNSNLSGDTGDWDASSLAGDACAASAGTGPKTFSSLDVQVMDAIGWTLNTGTTSLVAANDPITNPQDKGTGLTSSLVDSHLALPSLSGTTQGCSVLPPVQATLKQQLQSIALATGLHHAGA